jgi:uncharacterized protein YndB with AHSA1/START domain
MLKVLGIVAVVLAVAVAALLVYAATKPDEFRVQRSVTIKAPADRIFVRIVDLRGWAAWSPYEAKDPAMKRTFSGAASGRGAIYEWDGNKNVGTGRMEILEASAPSKIVIKLDFLKPFEAHNTAEFTLVPQGDSTAVTWSMYGPSAYLHKVMQTLMDMDKMVGTDFAVGLQSLKALTEKGP